MPFKRYHRNLIKTFNESMPVKRALKRGVQLFLVTFIVMGCEDFVDVGLPNNQVTSETVFEDAATATAALKSIYDQMRDNGLVSVGFITNLGLYTDEWDDLRNSNDFYNHSLLASNSTVNSYWSSAYNLVYAANTVIEGVDNSVSLSLENQNQLKGEALFVRAYLHSLLVELWGPVPYITTTDYSANTNVFRMPVNNVYNHIINDLKEASSLLGDDVSGGSEVRIRPYAALADALLARVYLYTGQWSDAEERATHVIGQFVWEPDLNKVFLKNASGTIWQFKPFLEGDNTDEGNTFILTRRPSRGAVLSESIIEAFEPHDLRKINWVGNITSRGQTWHYAFKYKERFSTDSSLEYPVIFRLAEQYLIRAEARAEQGDIPGAQADLNVIRNRAGLPNTTADTRELLLEAVLYERQVELFAERGGHRWFDLKRTGEAANVLVPIKPGWRETDILFPIPESETLLNPNLLPQNDGYD